MTPTTTTDPAWVKECQEEMKKAAAARRISIEELIRRENSSWHESQLELARERFDDPEYSD